MGGICFVAHFAYGSVNGGRVGHVGGVERQVSLMGRWLASRGQRVSLLTWDEGQEKETVIDGVRIIAMCRRDAGIPGLRFFTPRWTSLNKAMAKADAGVYYHNCAEYVTGQVALWCRRHGRKFVFSVASDPECDPELPELKTTRERVLYRYGIRTADRVVVQTRKQQEMLGEGFGVKADVLPMPCPDPGCGAPQESRGNRKGGFRVLWAGRIARVKRLELLLDIAESLPDVWFDVAGGPDDDEAYAAEVSKRAASLPNVMLHGRVERERMDDHYRDASVLCCTSLYEGFPNTFLEAWSHGLPIVSTVDPDGLIERKGLGVAATKKEALVAGIGNLRQDPERYREIERKARGYFLENHSVDAAMSRFERLFAEVGGESPRERVKGQP